MPGYTRRKSGRGFRWLTPEGRPASNTESERLRQLAIPPAWEDVWVCPWPNGHIQATGIDAAGRKQYRYHDQWRQTQDARKHQRVLDVARSLPEMRIQVMNDLKRRGTSRRKSLALAARLLDLGFFRIGSEQYERLNGTVGLATITCEQIEVGPGGVFFEYVGKSGKVREHHIVDPISVRAITALTKGRSPEEEFLAWRPSPSSDWVDIKSYEINAYLQEVSGLDLTAKDFRTWHATVLAAVGLAVSKRARSENEQKRAIARVAREVAEYLGNTPAVARASYIDPRVIDKFRGGEVIDLSRLGDQANFGELATIDVEPEVVRLLSD